MAINCWRGQRQKEVINLPEKVRGRRHDEIAAMVVITSVLSTLGGPTCDIASHRRPDGGIGCHGKAAKAPKPNQLCYNCMRLTVQIYLDYVDLEANS